MTTDQKRNLSSWKLNTKYTAKKGGKISLASIIDNTFKNFNGTEDSMPQLLDNIHPYLYFNFVVRWDKLPSTHIPRGFNDGVELGKEVIRKWRDECWKLKFFNYGTFSIFNTIDQLNDITDKILNGSISYAGGYEKLEEEIYMVRQAEIDEEEKRKIDELQRLEELRLAEIEEGKKKEAARIAEEERRLKKEMEAKERAEANKQFQSKDNSPWSSGVSTTKSPKPTTVEAVAVIKQTKKSTAKDLNDSIYTGKTNKANAVMTEFRSKFAEFVGLIGAKKADAHLYFSFGKPTIEFVIATDVRSETMTGKDFADIFLQMDAKCFQVRQANKAIEEERKRKRSEIEEQIKALQAQLKNI